MKFCKQCYKFPDKCKCKPAPKNKRDYKVVNGNSHFRRVIKRRILERDMGRCQRCWIKKGKIVDDDLQIHHIKSQRDYEELAYDDDNLIATCQNCNLELGTDNKLDFEWSPPEQDITII